MATRLLLFPLTRVLRSTYIASNVLPQSYFAQFKTQISCLRLKAHDKDIRSTANPQEQYHDHKTAELRPEAFGVNPDIFGNASVDDRPPDPGDVEEDELIQNPTRRFKKTQTREYAKLIKEHLKNNRLQEAIDVLEVKMLKEDCAKPENYIFNLLISGCAKAGYTRMAFKLYNDMKRRHLKVKEATYTSLFNACANAPSIADGLTKANRLREIMLEKGYEPNARNYNAMIKAYGRCGDTKTAYMLADEMLDKKLEVNTDTFNFLLQACASDKRFGFRHALLTWHKIYKNGLKPDYYSFNSILRCVRDTELGDVESCNDVLKAIMAESSQEPQQLLDGTSQTPQLQLASDANQGVDQNTSQEIHASDNTTGSLQNIISDIRRPEFETPNFLIHPPQLGSLISVEEIKQPHERLLLLGGFSGFLLEMKKHGITPDIETFTTLLEVIPPTYAAEKQLLMMIRKIGLKADIDFFNILIKKRSMRFEYEGAKEVLSMIQTAGLRPDIVTYGVLALGCRTQEAARELMQEMRDKNIRMNVVILGAMLKQGCVQKLFPYIMEILQISLDENIRPNDIFLRHLDKFYKQCANLIDIQHRLTKTKAFRSQHSKFCSKYRAWKEEHGIEDLKLEDAIKKIKERPYDQFTEKRVGGIEEDKNEKLARKSKYRKYIKKIKVKNLRDDEDVSPKTNPFNRGNIADQKIE